MFTKITWGHQPNPFEPCLFCFHKNTYVFVHQILRSGSFQTDFVFPVPAYFISNFYKVFPGRGNGNTRDFSWGFVYPRCFGKQYKRNVSCFPISHTSARNSAVSLRIVTPTLASSQVGSIFYCRQCDEPLGPFPDEWQPNSPRGLVL